MAVNSVLVIGEPEKSDNPLVRVHSSCLTGDVLGSRRCECGPQLESALDRIADDPAGGYLIYMAGHEGRGIGLWAKAATYLLQDAGENTYQANRSLGLPDDSRDFSDAAVLLKYFAGGRNLRLLTNNPKKQEDLAALGVPNIEQVKHVVGVDDYNLQYLKAKRDWGHKLGEEDLSDVTLVIVIQRKRDHRITVSSSTNPAGVHDLKAVPYCCRRPGGHAPPFHHTHCAVAEKIRS